LLPAASGCGVIVTSRGQLAGLAIREGAIRISLGPLPQQEAVSLLVEIVGERADADPKRTAELARLCSCWPLALRIISERLVSQEHLGLADLCDELREARLDALSINEQDDETAAVRAVFDLSYQALTAEDAATFRLLGLHPGTHIGIGAVAALCGQPEVTARARMRRLCQAHLVTEYQRDRYQLHDLLKAYAAERTETDDSLGERRFATRRLLDYYFGTVANTTAMLAPYRKHPVVDVSPLSTVPETYEEALAWCDAEVSNFHAIVSLAVARGYPQVWRFAASLWDYFHVRRPWGSWWATTKAAQCQLAEDPDAFGKAWLLNSLGDYLRRRGESAAARAHFEEALAIRQEIGDRPGQGWLWWCLGLTKRTEGKPYEAVRDLRESLAIFTELDDVYAQGRCLQLTGHALWDAGDRDGAISHLHDALDCFTKVDDPHDQALVFSALGRIHGDAKQAIEYLDAALPTLREIGDWQGEVDALIASGEAQWRLGNSEQARQHWSDATRILGDREEADQIAMLDARINEITSAQAEASPGPPRQEAPLDC
jgi:tetratricopeptide (TPR) repeat protein